MDNIQLTELFNSVLELDNSFDRMLKLKSSAKQYKTSQFYKATRMSIYDAYELFVKDSIATEAMHIKRFASAEFVGEYITDLLDHISPDAVENLLDQIIDSLRVNELLNESAKIGEQLKKLQR